MLDSPDSLGLNALAELIDLVVLGKIVGPHGLRGAVKVHPFADDPQGWGKLSHWWVGQDAERPETWQHTKLRSGKLSGDTLIVELECIPDRNASENAKGLFVGVSRSELPAAAKNEYYWADLIGLDVVNTKDQCLGQVLGLIETPANEVLRVGELGCEVAKERLLPFVASVVLDVDLAAKQIRVEWEIDW